MPAGRGYREGVGCDFFRLFFFKFEGKEFKLDFFADWCLSISVIMELYVFLKIEFRDVIIIGKMP